MSCHAISRCALRQGGRIPCWQAASAGADVESSVTSAVVVVTAAVRSMFGSSIDAAWAPDVLTTIGSGAAEITIRLIAPHGALAYQSALQAGVAGRKQYGTALLDNNQIVLSQAAQNQLAAGQVDHGWC